jgi:hypothetical protein
MGLEHSPEHLTDLSADESKYVLAAAQRARRLSHPSCCWTAMDCCATALRPIFPPITWTRSIA